MIQAEVTKAVILARGLGTRMRRRGDGAEPLRPDQESMADRGIKALIPVGRPFLDYVLSSLADAGFRDVCLVIGPEHEEMREYYTRICTPQRIVICFAVQERPLGTADAVAAAESFAAGDAFLALNSDNYYPTTACRDLRLLGRPALAAFERRSLERGGNIPPERIRQFAVVDINPDGSLARITEKPNEITLTNSMRPEAWISMNLWILGPTIFSACASISPSARGELELTDAVQYAIQVSGERFQVLRVKAPVLDLSSRQDIAAVAENLRKVEVRL